MKQKHKRQPESAQPGGGDKDSVSGSGRPGSKAPAWLARWRVAGLVLLYVMLALNFIRLPKVAVNLTHDLGSHMSFEYYAREKAQFGLDVIQNVGPYGYLHYSYDYSGILPTQKLLFGVLFGMVVAWYALEARKYFAGTTAKALWFLTIFMMLVPEHEDVDPISYLFIFLAGHHLLMARRDGVAAFASDALLCIVLGLLSMMKSMNVMLTGLLMTLVLVDRIRSRRFLSLAWDYCWTGGTALFLWVHAGQKITNAVAFMRGAMAFSNGYNDALAFIGRPEMVWLGMVVFAVFAAVNALRLWQFRAYWQRIPLMVFESACLFIVWKHGYVRAGHEVIFWAVIAPVAPLLFLAHEHPNLPEKSGQRTARAASWRARLLQSNFSLYQLAGVPVAIVLLCTVWASHIEKENRGFADYANPWTAVANPIHRMWVNLAELAELRSHFDALKAELAKNRADAALPDAAKVIGNGTVDEFGFLPGVVLLNGFNYRPRPMPINFAATTEMLMQRNADFYANDATAPDFLLANIGQLDGRLGPQDDALALLEVLGHYTPVTADHGFIVMKRVPGKPALERVPLETRTLQWGESTPVPASDGKPLWCAVDVRYSLMGRARAFLYQPPQVYIIFETQTGRVGPIRMLQSGASTGFLLRPLIQNGVDFLSVYGVHAQPVSALMPPFNAIGFVVQDAGCFQPTFKVTFSTVEPKK